MKKLVFAVVALLAVVAVSASAAYVVKPDTVDALFHDYTEIDWTGSWTRGDNGNIVITNNAYLDGYPYQIVIEGTDNGVSTVTMTGWFEDMKMLDMGQFSDGLTTYNNLFMTCTDFLPDSDELYEVFEPYDIYYSVLSGSSDFEGSYPNWELLSTPSGRLAMRNGSSMMEAQRMDDGSFRFTVTF